MFPELNPIRIDIVFSFHSQMRDDRMRVELQNEELAISVDLCEGLPDQNFDKLFRFYLLHNRRIVKMDVFDFLGFGFQKRKLKKSSHGFHFGEFWHNGLYY